MSKEHAISVLSKILKKYGCVVDFSFDVIKKASYEGVLTYGDYVEFISACEALGI